jgi:hypothetical protein
MAHDDRWRIRQSKAGKREREKGAFENTLPSKLYPLYDTRTYDTIIKPSEPQSRIHTVTCFLFTLQGARLLLTRD